MEGRAQPVSLSHHIRGAALSTACVHSVAYDSMRWLYHNLYVRACILQDACRYAGMVHATPNTCYVLESAVGLGAMPFPVKNAMAIRLYQVAINDACPRSIIHTLACQPTVDTQQYVLVSGLPDA